MTATPTSNSVTLEWEPVDGAEGYQVLLYANSNGSGLIQTWAGEFLSIEKTGLSSGTTYYYKVSPVWNEIEVVSGCAIQSFTTS